MSQCRAKKKQRTQVYIGDRLYSFQMLELTVENTNISAYKKHTIKNLTKESIFL